EPDERTRLLAPRPPREDGYLDPDDPAVSPYNLWTVRFLRYVTTLFLAFSFVWWVLLLVTVFVTPPGMHTRGSGFTDFAYTCLTCGNLLVLLLFFAAPSRAMRVLAAVIAFFLLVDTIVILAVGRLRDEEGAVGIASVVWCTLMAVWVVIVDRAVAWGKREEEERLTGRPETRRSLREWLAVLVATVIQVVYIVIVVLMTATMILRARDASLGPPGERYYVDGGKYAVHLHCVGNLTSTGASLSLSASSSPSDNDIVAQAEYNPTVLISSDRSPAEHTLSPFILSAFANGTIPRYCIYDRAGYAWSDTAPSPHSAGMSADALAEALALAGEPGPWVVAGAGYGAVHARIFAARNLKRVAGMLLLDPLHEDLLGSRVGRASDGFVTWGWGIVSPLGLERLGGALFKGRSREDRVYGRSAGQNGRLIRAHLQENLVADSLTKSEVRSARNIQDASTPLAVVSSGVEVGRSDEWAAKQEDLTTLTDHLVAWDVVTKAPHEVWSTKDGRDVIEKRMGELVKLARKAK
ncbi:mitochondrial integral membrane protein-like protein, partial [Lineolata rhizophorae]